MLLSLGLFLVMAYVAGSPQNEFVGWNTTGILSVAGEQNYIGVLVISA
jgi:hypothetical protein